MRCTARLLGLATASLLVLGGCAERSAGPLGTDPGSITPPRQNIGGSAPGDRPAAAPSVPGEIVVEVALGVDVETLNDTWGTTTLLELENGTHALLGVPSGGSVTAIASEMVGSGDCTTAEPNWIAEAPESEQGTIPLYEGGATPEDVVDQDALNRIGVAAAHLVTTGGGITVAVLDTGIDATHPDLAASVFPVGWDFIDDDASPTDAEYGIDSDDDGLYDEAAGHGTHVAGLVHAVAPGASLMAVRVLDSEGNGTVVSVARGIRFATLNGADVINLSLGMYVDADVVKDAIEAAVDAGIVVVTAGGNRGLEDEDHFPSRLGDTIGVAALDAQDLKAPFSNFGSSIDVSAPGVGLLSTYLDHGYATWSGTSMATPLVAGGAALTIAALVASEPDAVRDALAASCAELHHEGFVYDGKLGAGRIDVGRAVLLSGE